MAHPTRRQFLRALCGGGVFLGLGTFVACGQPDSRPAAGAGRAAASPSLVLTPVVTIYPPRPTIEGTLTLPTAVPDPNGATVVPKTPDPNLPIPTAFYPTPRPEDPICYTIQGARFVDPARDTRESALVVIARVTAIHPARWTTANGARPANPLAPGAAATIFTPIDIQVEQAIKGVPPIPLLVLSDVGTVGQDCRRIGDGLNDFTTVGERVVLFLNPPETSDPLQPKDTPRWYIAGRYTITPDGQATNSYQTLPLANLLAIIATAGSPTSPAPTPSVVVTPSGTSGR